MTYRDYLKSLDPSATDADLSVLDTPLGRKGWEMQQGALNTAEQKRIAAESKRAEYQKWYDDEAQPAFAAAINERDAAKANYAAEVARNKALQEAGLIAVAETVSPGSTSARTGETPAFDASKYVDRDTLMQVAEREGDAIAAFADISREHSTLFPDTPVSFRDLRKKAVATKRSTEQVWIEDFGVEAARAARITAKQKEREDKLVSDAVKAKEVELASKYGNPFTSPAIPSRSAFTEKPPSTLKAEEQPWNRNESLLQQARVEKVMRGLVN